ncbi:MAG: hypothetical protein WDW38_010610 [Sanguina aurantia]
MAAIMQKPMGMSLTRSRVSTVSVTANIKKVDIKKQGMNSIEEGTIKQNLAGTSRFMKKKDWKDASGSKGKGYGVYRFQDKYGVNVDGYSPIWTPDVWSKTGDSYKLGTNGLIAWAGLIVVLLGLGLNLIISTSQIGA